MKKYILPVIAFLTFAANVAFAQEAEKIELQQITGGFTETELTLKAGHEYVFEVTNKDVDHAVGFVIAPKGQTDQEHHVKEGYLSKTIEKGETASSQTVTLAKGEYVYFCPLNPTPQYTLKVE